MLSTIHQAKGLEWSQVFVPRLIEESFPHRRALEEPGGDEDEERRIFYVAITRAMNELTLTYPATISLAGRGPIVFTTPSRFLTEIDAGLAGTGRNRDPADARLISRAGDERRESTDRALRRIGHHAYSTVFFRDRPCDCGRWSSGHTRRALVANDPKAARPMPFRIQVVDEGTGRGVPLVELKTVNQIRYYTDSNGIVAFDEPGLLNPQGLLLDHEPRLRSRKGRLRLSRGGIPDHRGWVGQVVIRRLNIARRLYRVTGAGHLSRQRADRRQIARSASHF